MAKKNLLSRTTATLLVFSIFVALILTGPRATAAPNVRADAQRFIDEYTATWTRLRYEYEQAEWKSNTMIVFDKENTCLHISQRSDFELSGNLPPHPMRFRSRK